MASVVQKKICLLGAFAVGKTSLVMRYVNSIFGEKYHTTVGVKIDKKQLVANGEEITLMQWGNVICEKIQKKGEEVVGIEGKLNPGGTDSIIRLYF